MSATPVTKGLTREQIHTMQKNAKYVFVDWVIRNTREQVEDDIAYLAEEGTPQQKETRISFLVSRKHLSLTQEIYAGLKDNFPDSFVHIKVKTKNLYGIPCWKQYLIDVAIKWD